MPPKKTTNQVSPIPPSAPAASVKPKKASPTVPAKTITKQAPVQSPVVVSAPPRNMSRRHFVAEWLWLLIPTLLAAIGWWYGIRQLITTSLSSQTALVTATLFFTTIIGYAFLGGIFGLFPYGVRNRMVNALWALVLGLTAFFWHPFTIGTGLATVAFAIGLWAAAEAITREASSRRKIDVRSTLAHVMPWVVIGLSLATALLFYDRAQSIADPRKDTAQLIDRVVVIAESFGPKFVDGFKATMTIDELIDAQLPTADELIQTSVKGSQVTDDESAALRRRLEDLGLGELVLPPAGSDAAAVRQAINDEIARSRGGIIDEVRSGLGDQLGISLRGDATVHEALTALVEDRVGSRSTVFVQFVPPILSIGLFLALRLISPFLEIFAVAAGWFWYRALRVAHVLKIKTIPGTIEVVEWGN